MITSTNTYRLKIIPAVKKAPMVISRSVTDFNFMSAVGNHFETRSFRFRDMRNPALPALVSCSACNQLTNDQR